MNMDANMNNKALRQANAYGMNVSAVTKRYNEIVEELKNGRKS